MISKFTHDTQTDWLHRAEKELKGKAPESLNWKNSTGLEFKPYYSYESQHRRYPVLHSRNDNSWDIYEEIRVDQVAEANALALRVLNEGATGLRFVWNTPKAPDLTVLLKDIGLPYIQSAFVVPVSSYPDFCLMLAEYVRRQGYDAQHIEGYIQADCSGLKNGKELAGLLDSYVAIIPAVSAALKGYRLLVMDAASMGIAGLRSHEELGLALAWFREWIEQLEQQGVSYAQVPRLWQLNLSVGREYYTELCKFRVTGHLLSLVGDAYARYNPMYIHAQVREWYLSPMDRYNNLLRLTTSSMSAILGNCNGLQLPAFSDNAADPEGFVRRITRNIQLVLHHESWIGEVIDPAAGSYFMEEMSFALAEQAWDFFLDIQDKGGLSSYLKKGYLDEQLKSNREELREEIGKRKQFFLGVNQYPNTMEGLPDHKENNHNLLHALHLAEPFLALKHKSGQKKAVLLKYGNLAMRNARAGFAANFLQCGNWLTEEQLWDGGELPLADMLVLCAADEDYPSLLERLPDPGKTRLILAGNPGEKEAEYRNMGVDDFIHVRTPLYETLKRWEETDNA